MATTFTVRLTRELPKLGVEEVIRELARRTGLRSEVLRRSLAKGPHVDLIKPSPESVATMFGIALVEVGLPAIVVPLRGDSGDDGLLDPSSSPAVGPGSSHDPVREVDAPNIAAPPEQRASWIDTPRSSERHPREVLPTPPSSRELVARLRSFPLLDGAPDEELLWLATEGRWERYETGELVAAAGAPVTALFFLLSGRVAGYLGGGVRVRKVVERRAGEFTGVLPFSRLASWPGDVAALETLELIALPHERFPDMLQVCRELTAITVHVMVDRARHYNSAALHNEKMVSLGKLSAGLAHELDNPASAIARSAHDLGDRLTDADESVHALVGAGIDAEKLAVLERVRARCVDPQMIVVRSPIEQADREDEFADWLDDHGVDAALAVPLSETSITLETFDEMAAVLAETQLGIALAWIARSCSLRGLALEIGEAAGRIHRLVGAVKGFTHMDRAPVSQPVDVASGLASTLAMLESRVRECGASVMFDLPPELPQVRGFVGDLNQVWMNLLDNALDAIADGGRVEVGAAVEDGWMVVRIRDDGSGIPDNVRPHIFDPFFTTKGVGEGTGLGLDIVRRLVEGHDGTIEVETGPGGTEFRIGLPLVETGET